MDINYSVATAPKTATFQMRINPEIKAKMEDIYAKCGLTFTDAVNIFIQQSLNVEGLPFVVTSNNKELMRAAAIAQLMAELRKGEASVQQSEGWLTQEDILKELGGNG